MEIRGGVVIVAILWLTTSVYAKSDPVNGQTEGVKIVKTSQGAIRGHKDPNTGVFTFHGVPYATAPVKSQRFKAPLPGPIWLRTLDAVDKGIVCPQPESYLGSKVIHNKTVQDDCLIANIYVPDTSDGQLPVVVYIHGGAYQKGFGNMNPPIYFVKEKNVIAITFNYRLGMNGFLCLGTKDVPGNAGLKDQLALLRWVKKNIAYFGGNPDDVTITGQSAGSVSVDLLMLSKTTTGLFNKVIPESGSSISIISLQIDPLETAKSFAQIHGFSNVDDIYALEKFFQDSPNDVFTEDGKNSTYGFVPCVERNSGKDVFLDDTPYNIIRKRNYRKIPMLFGLDNMEGLYKIPQFNTWKKDMNDKFSDFLPADLQFENDKQKEEIAKEVKEFYFGHKQIDETTILGYIDFFTDVHFAYPILRSVKLHAEAGHDEIYLYEYSFVDNYVPPVPFTNVRGATHCAQVAHVLDTRQTILNPEAANATQEYVNLRNIMQEMWYNFIRTGKPVPEYSLLPQWPAAGKDLSPHMSLGTKVELRGPLMQERVRFWDNIYSKYYREPKAPPPPPPKSHAELSHNILN